MVLIGQKMQLTGWHNGNEMSNEICVDTHISNEWSCCPFPIATVILTDVLIAR